MCEDLGLKTFQFSRSTDNVLFSSQRNEHLFVASSLESLYRDRGGGRAVGVRAAVFDQLTESLEAAWSKLRKEGMTSYISLSVQGF